MEDKSTSFEVLLDRAQAYIRISIQLFKLRAADKIAEMMSNLASVLSILAILAFFFVNLNIGIALLVGNFLGKTWLGFIILAGVYACIGFVIFVFRDRWIKKPLRDSIVEQLLKDEDSDNSQLSD